jgi:hypothetical protein
VSKKFNIEFIRAEFAKENYTLLTKIYSISWANWQKGARCPRCSHKISKWEEEVKNSLSQSNIDHVPNDRTQLVNSNTNHKLELDIWFPKLNKAIECNGVYWYSKPDRKECDKIKQ